MSLLERANTLSKHVADLDQLAASQVNFEKLRTRSRQIDQLVAELKKIVRSSSLLQKQKIVTGELPIPSKELRTKSKKVQEEFARDAFAVVNDEQIQMTFFGPITAYGKRLHDFLAATWRQHVDSVAPKINDGLLTTLKGVLGAQVSQLQALRQELEALRATLPSEEKAFSELNRIATEMSTIWRQLEGVPATVRAFLVKAAQRQATISELTPEVRDWLAKNSMLEQLRIGFV